MEILEWVKPFLCCCYNKAWSWSNVLGMLSRQGLGPIVPLSETVTGAIHVIILHKHIIPTIRLIFPNSDGLF